MKKLVSACAAVVVAVVSACGGNVVGDGSGASTGGTAGASGTRTQPGTGAASCFNLPPRASPSLCGGCGGRGSCTTICSCGDPAGSWEADCSGSSCQCLYSGTVLCDCA